MEERPPEEPGPDWRSEDLNTAQETDINKNDDLRKPDDYDGGAGEEQSTIDNVPENTLQNALENASENTLENSEEDVKTSVGDIALITYDSEEIDTFDLENMEEEPESPEEEDSRQSTVTDAPQSDLQPDSEENPELLQELSELQTEHEYLSDLNYQLQSKLAEYFQLKSGEDLQLNQVSYQEYLDIMEDLKKQWEDMKQMRLHQRHVDNLLQQSNEKTEEVELEWKKLMSSQREVLISALDQVKSRTEAEAEAERLMSATQKCEDESVPVRKENFKLNRLIHQLEPELHFREKKLDGEMSYIEYEQLNIENLNFSEKIQECKEDLLKLKRMLPQTAQILMHVKEKLRFVQVEKQKQQERFDELDFSVLHEQQMLTETMQTRDNLRFHNLRIRQDGGLLGRPKLLRDLEDTEDKREALEEQVEMLKRS